MSNKSDRAWFILLQIFIGISVLGLIILIATNYQNPSQIAFSLIAFIISVAALVMTTLQSVSIAKQVRTTNRAAHLVRESMDQLHELIKEERLIEKEIRRDMKIDEEVIGILEEYGIGATQDERSRVASKIASKVHELSKK